MQTNNHVNNNNNINKNYFFPYWLSNLLSLCRTAGTNVVYTTVLVPVRYRYRIGTGITFFISSPESRSGIQKLSRILDNEKFRILSILIRISTVPVQNTVLYQIGTYSIQYSCPFVLCVQHTELNEYSTVYSIIHQETAI